MLSWFMSFFDEKVARRLLGEPNVPHDCVPTDAWRFGASDRADWKRKVRYARATGNCTAGVGWGTCIAFGHGAPGEFRERLIQAGNTHRIFCDDLGSGRFLLMSPALYRRFFLPWHRRLAELCHRYGAYLHMHSHGNINPVVGDLYEAGIDLLNPNDPQEGMDLPALKREYGDRMTFVGGLDKFFFDWDYARQESYVTKLIEDAGGVLILMDSGGVPDNVTPEGFDRIRAVFERVKRGQQGPRQG